MILLYRRYKCNDSGHEMPEPRLPDGFFNAKSSTQPLSSPEVFYNSTMPITPAAAAAAPMTAWAPPVTIGIAAALKVEIATLVVKEGDNMVVALGVAVIMEDGPDMRPVDPTAVAVAGLRS